MVVQRGADTPHRGSWYEARTVFERISGRQWRAVMRTGVMHQIRVHAAFLGIPLAGDRKYGGGPSPSRQPGIDFWLHHEGLDDGAGLRTDPVDLPEWSRGSA
jgi:23S rRNA-/tRNA-specific pseudouridylate synthase